MVKKTAMAALIAAAIAACFTVLYQVKHDMSDREAVVRCKLMAGNIQASLGGTGGNVEHAGEQLAALLLKSGKTAEDAANATNMCSEEIDEKGMEVLGVAVHEMSK